MIPSPRPRADVPLKSLAKAAPPVVVGILSLVCFGSACASACQFVLAEAATSLPPVGVEATAFEAYDSRGYAAVSRVLPREGNSVRDKLANMVNYVAAAGNVAEVWCTYMQHLLPACPSVLC